MASNAIGTDKKARFYIFFGQLNFSYTFAVLKIGGA